MLCSDVERAVFGESDDSAKPPVPINRLEADSPANGSSSGDDTADKQNSVPSDGREEARRAARRIVAFGWQSQGVEEDRPVQAVQVGKEVETSFAKGEWGLRWRGAA